MAATKGVFDIPAEVAIDAFTDAIDDLHEVDSEADTVSAGMATMNVSMMESPVWSYGLAALVVAAPFIAALLVPWVNLTIDEDGVRFADDWSDSSRLLALGSFALTVAACLFGGYLLATRFKRPVHQATVTFAPERGGPGTRVRIDGRPDPYVYRAIRRVFDEYDRDEIERRAGQATAMSVAEFLEFGPSGGRSLFGRPRRAPQQVASAPIAPADEGTIESAASLPEPVPTEPPAMPEIEPEPGAMEQMQAFLEGGPVRPPESS